MTARSGARGQTLRRMLFLGGLAALAAGGWWAHGQWFAERPAEAREAVASAGGSAPGSAPAQAPAAVPVEVATAVESAAAVEIRSVGTLKSDESVLIASELPGRIAEILFDEGQQVAEGQLLIRLDDSLAQVELKDAEAALVLAQSNFDRAAKLAQSGTGTQRTLDEAQSELARARAAVDLIRVRLDKLSLTAPFDGMVGIRRISVGAYISAGDTLVNLEKIDRLKVDFKVPELFLAQVKVGQSVIVDLDALPDQHFEATIYTIDPLLDVNGRALNVRATLPNPDLVLRPGLFARVTVQVDQARRVVMVPEEAIVPRGTQHLVYRVVEGHAEEVVATLGARRDGQVEILQGLRAGDVVVITGHSRLRDGAAVEILPPFDGGQAN